MHAVSSDGREELDDISKLGCESSISTNDAVTSHISGDLLDSIDYCQDQKDDRTLCRACLRPALVARR